MKLAKNGDVLSLLPPSLPSTSYEHHKGGREEGEAVNSCFTSCPFAYSDLIRRNQNKARVKMLV